MKSTSMESLVKVRVNPLPISSASNDLICYQSMTVQVVFQPIIMPLCWRAVEEKVCQRVLERERICNIFDLV